MTAKEKTFRLHYYVQNNGDGSASVRLCETEEQADTKADDEEWGERCSSYETIVLKRGKLYYKDGGKLIPLEEVK